MTPRPAPATARLSYWRRRIRRHIYLALGSVGLTAGLLYVIHSGRLMTRLSMALAYAALAFLGATLVIGPWNVFRSRPNPVSTDLRRDIGIWSAILALAHVAVGLQVHMDGNIWHYFFDPSVPRRLRVRLDAFGLANHTGLGVTLILAGLLALSNNRSLRWLGVRRWKLAHRSSYIGFVLVVCHGALYEVLERRSLPFVALFVAIAATVTVLQFAGFRRMRSRTRRGPISTPPAALARQQPASTPRALSIRETRADETN